MTETFTIFDDMQFPQPPAPSEGSIGALWDYPVFVRGDIEVPRKSSPIAVVRNELWSPPIEVQYRRSQWMRSDLNIVVLPGDDDTVTIRCTETLGRNPFHQRPVMEPIMIYSGRDRNESVGRFPTTQREFMEIMLGVPQALFCPSPTPRVHRYSGSPGVDGIDLRDDETPERRKKRLDGWWQQVEIAYLCGLNDHAIRTLTMGRLRLGGVPIDTFQMMIGSI